MSWLLVLAGCLLGAALSGANGSLLLGILIGGAAGRIVALVAHLGRREGDKIVAAFQGKKPQPKAKPRKPRLQVDQFTPHALDVLQRTKEAAWRWRHDYLATEHLLLGLVESRSGTLQAAMHELFLPDAALVRAELEPHVEPPRRDFSPDAPLRKTPRFSRTLERAATLAAECDAQRVDAVHLFGALLEENDGIAARVLRSYTTDFEDARRLILDHVRHEVRYEQPA